MKTRSMRLWALVLGCILVLGLAACTGEAAPDGTSAPTGAVTPSDPTSSADPTTPVGSTPTVPHQPIDPTAPPLSGDCSHTDGDQDGLCDACGGSVWVELHFFAVNDIHGKFKDSASQPGVDELTSYLRLQGENAIFLSSGDTWQGSSESNLTQGKLMTEWMNELGFVSMTLGNHEFDWGTEYIEANAELADFPLLAINIYDRDTNERADFCTPSVTIDRAGITIGIIGAMGDCYSSISGDKTGDIYFRTGSDLTALVKAEAQRLRDNGADIIVYSIHDGSERSLDGKHNVTQSQMGSYYDTDLSDGYVDLVFEAHTHKRYTFSDEHGVWHLQAGGENSGISHATVVYDLITDEISTVSGTIAGNTLYDDFPSDPLIQQLLDKYADQIAQGDEVIGYSNSYLSSDQIRDLVAELYYAAGVERWGKDYDIALAGALISVRNPYNIPSGQIKYSQLQSVLPFDNDIVLCSVKGSTLRDRFFETDDERYGIYYEAYGDALRDNIDPNGTYYLITDTYTSTYAPNRLTEVARYDSGIYARDLLADYIRENSAEPPSADNVKLTDIPTILSAGSALAPGATSKESYYVQGTILSVANAKYGNVTIADDQGNELYIYGMYDENGTMYEGMADPPKAGDTVILYGQVQHYVAPSGDVIIELVHATLIEAK